MTNKENDCQETSTLLAESADSESLPNQNDIKLDRRLSLSDRRISIRVEVGIKPRRTNDC